MPEIEWYQERMRELMRPIDTQIMMCDNRDELLMLASIMMTTSKNIFRDQLGEEGSKELFRILFEHE
jgi:hypothetical protein